MKISPTLAGLALAASLFLAPFLSTAKAVKVVGDKVNIKPSIQGGAPLKLSIYNFNSTPATGFWVTPEGILQSLPGAATIPPTGTTPIVINSFRYASIFLQRPEGGGILKFLDDEGPTAFIIAGTPPKGFKAGLKKGKSASSEVAAADDDGPDGKKKKVVNVTNNTTVTPPAPPAAPGGKGKKKTVTNTTTNTTITTPPAPVAPAPAAPAPTAPKAGAALRAFEDGGYYYLTSRFTGEEKVLSAVKAGPVAKAELAAKRDKKASANQSWKVTSLGNGYYRLTTKALGDGYSLDVIGDDPENDQMQLVKTGDYSGQAWKITEEKDGYFRLTTQFKGPSLSLDVCNEGDKSKMVGLIRSNDSAGQFWMFRKASGGKKK